MNPSPCSHASSRRSRTTDSRRSARRDLAAGAARTPPPAITSRSGGKLRPPPLPCTPPSPRPRLRPGQRLHSISPRTSGRGFELRSGRRRGRVRGVAHRARQPRGQLRVLLQRIGRFLAAGTESLPAEREPGATLLDQAALAGEVEKLVRARDAHPVEDVELGLAERRRQLVLHHLDPRTRSDHLIAFLERTDAADVQAHRGVELERVPAGSGLRRPEDDADLHADLVDEHDRRPIAAHHGGQLAQRLRHEPRLQAHVLVAHFAFDLGLGHQRGHRVDHHQIDRSAAHQGLRDLQGLLAGVGLGDEQLLDLHAQLPGVSHVERVLRVDEGGAPALRLHLRDGMQRESRLPARLGPVDLHHPAARIPAAAQRDVQPQRAALDDRDRLGGLIALSQAHDRALAELLLDGAHRRENGFQLLRYLAHVTSGMAPDDASGGTACSAASRARWMLGTGGADRPWTGRSRQRYCTASSTCLASTVGCPSSRSATVRASFSTRSCARADRPSRSIIFASTARASLEARDSSRSARPRSWALAYTPGIARNRWRCSSRAIATRSRTVAELSPAGIAASSDGFSAPASTCRSILSRMGPETRLRYRCFSSTVHWHRGSPSYPQGQGFIAAMSMKREGSSAAPRARTTATSPSSRGWRRASRAARPNSGSSY